MNKKTRILEVLNTLFDRPGKEAKGPELIYYCPFCDHHKRKLQINIDTQQWHCWVCGSKGRSIFVLAKKLHAPKGIYKELNAILESYLDSYESKRDIINLQLPNEFKPLKSDSESGIVVGHAMRYLESRDISKDDITRYNIGYCIGGDYSNRIIIPSYDDKGQLNYFVGRSIYPGKLKYKNPPTSKNIIPFDLYINWNDPIILCEGVFDAMAIKRNAIPLLGKTIPEVLIKRMVERRVKECIIALDSDAKDTEIKIANRLMKFGIQVSSVSLKDKDPSELGYKNMMTAITNRSPVNEYNLILQRLI
jgi:DNA primase